MTRVHVCQCTCRVHGYSAVCACVVFTFFADGDSVYDTMSRRNTARTPDYLTLHRAPGWMVGEVGGQQKARQAAVHTCVGVTLVTH